METEIMTWKRPPCGGTHDETPAPRAQYVEFGVGFCDACMRDEDGEIVDYAVEATGPGDFNAWWYASALGHEAGDPRWEGLKYGEYPVGVQPLD